MFKLMRLKHLLRVQYRDKRIYFGIPELHKREEAMVMKLKEKTFKQMKSYKNRDLEINARLTAFLLRKEKNLQERILDSWRKRYRRHSRIHFHAVNSLNLQKRAFEMWLLKLRHERDVCQATETKHEILLRFKAFQRIKTTLYSQVIPLRRFTEAAATLTKQRTMLAWRYALIAKLNASGRQNSQYSIINDPENPIWHCMPSIDPNLIGVYRAAQKGYDELNSKYVALSVKCRAFIEIIERRAAYRAFYAWRGGVSTVRILKCLKLKKEIQVLRENMRLWREKTHFKKMQRMYHSNPRMHDVINKFLAAIGEKVIQNGGLYGDLEEQLSGNHLKFPYNGKSTTLTRAGIQYKPGEFNQANAFFIQLIKLDEVEKDSFMARKLLRSGLLAFKFNHDQMMARYTKANAFYEKHLRSQQRKIFYKFWTIWLHRKILYNFIIKKEETLIRKCLAQMLQFANTRVLTQNVNQFIRKYLSKVAFCAWATAVKNQKVVKQLRNMLLLKGVENADSIIEQLLRDCDDQKLTFNELLEKLINNPQLFSKLPPNVKEFVKQMLSAIPQDLMNTKQFQVLLQRQQNCDKFITKINNILMYKLFLYIKDKYYTQQAKEFKISQLTNFRYMQQANKSIVLQAIAQQLKQMHYLWLQRFAFEQFIISFNAKYIYNKMLMRVTLCSFKQYCKERSVEKFITQNFEQRTLHYYFQIIKRVSNFYYVLSVLKQMQDNYFSKIVQYFLQELYKKWKQNHEMSEEVEKQHNLNVMNQKLSGLLMYHRTIQIRHDIKNEQINLQNQKYAFNHLCQAKSQLNKKLEQQIFSKNKFIYHKMRQALKTALKQQNTFQTHNENVQRRIALRSLYQYYKEIQSKSNNVATLVKTNQQSKEAAEKLLLQRLTFQHINNTKQQLNQKQQHIQSEQMEHIKQTLIPSIYKTMFERSVRLQKQLNIVYKLHNKNTKTASFTWLKFEMYQKLIAKKGCDHWDLTSVKMAFRNMRLLYKAQHNYNLCLERLSLHSLIWFKKQCGQISYLTRVKIKESLRQWRRIAAQNAIHRHLEIKADRFYNEKLTLRAFQAFVLEGYMMIGSD